MTGHGVVTKTDGTKAKVLVTTSAECSGCASKGHCGMGEAKPREITVINTYGAGIDDHVEFEAETGKVIFSAALIWILPVVSMIVGYFVAEQFASGAIPIVAAFLFLVASFAVLKAFDSAVTGGTSFYPKISAILPPESVPDICVKP